MSGEGDTSFRSILGEFLTVIESDQKWILKCGQRHCNQYTLFYSYTKFRNDRGMQIGLFRSLEMRHSVVGYIGHTQRRRSWERGATTAIEVTGSTVCEPNNKDNLLMITILLNLVHCWCSHTFPHRASLMQHPWPAQLLCGIGECCWCVSSIACVHSEIYVTLF